MTNTILLEKTIAEKGLKYKYIAKEMNISYVSLRKKIDNITFFTVPEVDRICEILDISNANDIYSIFFDNKSD